MKFKDFDIYFKFNKIMDNKTVFEIYTEMEVLWESFKANHAIYAEKENKSAAGRARKAINELKKHVTAYKKASVESTKK
jgi:hypothetical protein